MVDFRMNWAFTWAQTKVCATQMAFYLLSPPIENKYAGAIVMRLAKMSNLC